MNTKKRIGLIIDILYFTVTGSFVWAAFTSIIQSFMCARLTQTEVFMRIPKSFVMDFINCI